MFPSTMLLIDFIRNIQSLFSKIRSIEKFFVQCCLGKSLERYITELSLKDHLQGLEDSIPRIRSHCGMLLIVIFFNIYLLTK